jgi:DedD protein
MHDGPRKSPAGRNTRWLRAIVTRLRLDEGRFSDEDVLQTLRAAENGVRIGDLCSAQGISVETYYRWHVRYGGGSLAELSRRRRRDRWSRRIAFGLVALVVLGIGYKGFLYLSAPAGRQASVIAPRTSTKPSPAPVRTGSSAALPQKPQTLAGAPNAAVPKSQAPAPPANVLPAQQPQTLKWIPNASPTQKPQPLVRVPTPPPAQKRQPPTAAQNPQKLQAPVPTAGVSRKPQTPAVAVNPPAQKSQAQRPVPGASPGGGDISTVAPPGYSVQVVAVVSLQDARQLLKRLIDAGYSAYIVRTAVGQVDMYRVRVGPFQSREQAEDAAGRLERDGFGKVWIAK